jgi:hypothetical protein
MPAFQRGSVRFEKSGPVGDTLFEEDAIFDYDCLPPLSGRRRKYVAPEQAPVLAPEEFLQQEEIDRLRKAARTSPRESLDVGTLLQQIFAAFDFRPLPYDYTKLPVRWWRREPCYDTMVSVQSAYWLYEITARATKELTFGAVTFPAGDVLAVFRIAMPISYQFVRRFRFNAECCPDRMPEPRSADEAGFTSILVIQPFRIPGVEFRSGKLLGSPAGDFDAPPDRPAGMAGYRKKESGGCA